MIKIQKDNDIKVVTKGAFDNLYSDMGYRIVGDKKPKAFKEAVVIENNNEDIKKVEKTEEKNDKSFINGNKKENKDNFTNKV